MKILQLNTNFRRGGIQRHTLDLSKWLVASGHDVHLMGARGEWSADLTPDQFTELDLLKVNHEGGALPQRLFNTVKCVWQLRRWLRANPVDVIHAHESAPALVADLARRGLGVPLVVTYHGSTRDRVRQFARIAGRADLVVTPSHASARDLVSLGGLPEAQVRVNGLGLQPAPMRDDARVDELRAALLGQGERLLVTIARLTEQKGIDVLIECIARMKRDHPTYRFVLVGTGALMDEMVALAAEKGVSDVLTFAGQTDRPHDYLYAGDAFLLTSRWESLPFTIPEAFQAGLPVVATACSGVVELVDEAVGQTVPVGDVDAICQAVAGVLSNDATRQALGAAALARSKEPRFDLDWTYSRLLDLYEQVN